MLQAVVGGDDVFLSQVLDIMNATLQSSITQFSNINKIALNTAESLLTALGSLLTTKSKLTTDSLLRVLDVADMLLTRHGEQIPGEVASVIITARIRLLSRTQPVNTLPGDYSPSNSTTVTIPDLGDELGMC